jgi:hypothetical protein
MSRLHYTRDFALIDMVIAERLGLHEAFLIARLFFRLEGPGNGFERDGVRYYRNTMPQWADEMRGMMSQRTIERMLAKLEDEGVILSCKAGKGFDQTKGYAINHDHPALNDEGTIPSQRRDADRLADGCHTDTEAGCSLDKKQAKTQGSTSVDEVADAFASEYSRQEEIDTATANPTHGPTLAKFWNRALHHAELIKHTPPMMGVKGQKQLKELFKKLPDPAVQILNVIQSYGLFVNEVTGGTKFPHMPTIPTPQVLLQHIEKVAEFEAPDWVEDSETDYEHLGLNIDEALADKG